MSAAAAGPGEPRAMQVTVGKAAVIVPLVTLTGSRCNHGLGARLTRGLESRISPSHGTRSTETRDRPVRQCHGPSHGFKD